MTSAERPDDGTFPLRIGGADAGSTVRSLNARRGTQESPEPGGRRRIPADDLEPIVRRAAELQNRQGNPGAGLLTEEEVVEIGRQVGLEPAYVRRAIAEAHAESLAPKAPPANRMLELVAGAARVEVRRVVAGDPATVQQQIEMQLRDREKLGALRQRPRRSVWEASTGTMDRLERWLNFSGREYALAEIRQVELAVAEIEPGWTLVTLAGDLGNKRDEVFYGGASGVAVLAVLSAFFSGQNAGSLLAVGVGLLVALLGAAVGIAWVRRALAKRRERIELILESLLDRVDR